MKKKLGFTALLIVSFTILSPASIKATPISLILSGKLTNGSVQIKTKQIKSSSDIINIDLKVPVLKGMNNKDFQNKINTKFLRDALDFKNQIEKSAVEFQKYAKEHNIPQRPFEANLSYKVTYNKDNLLSITFYYYKFTGGAHGGMYVISYNIDLKGGRTLALADLFKPGSGFKEKANVEILQQMINDGKPYFENAFKSISDNQPFYIEDRSIVIYFQEYEIAPYAAGIPKFKLPLSTFENDLNPALGLQ